MFRWTRKKAGYSRAVPVALVLALVAGCSQHRKPHEHARKIKPAGPTSAEAADPPVVVAARAGDVNRLRQLLDQGADVNARGAREMTPLMAAAATGRDDAARLLLDRGADANARGSRGLTASGWATEGGHVELAKTLRDAEVKPPPGPANPLPVR